MLKPSNQLHKEFCQALYCIHDTWIVNQLTQIYYISIKGFFKPSQRFIDVDLVVVERLLIFQKSFSCESAYIHKAVICHFTLKISAQLFKSATHYVIMCSNSIFDLILPTDTQSRANIRATTRSRVIQTYINNHVLMPCVYVR